MQKPLKHIGIIGRYQDKNLSKSILNITQLLHEYGVHVLLEEHTAHNTGVTHIEHKPLEDVAHQCDLLLVLGGDGTMISTARKVLHHPIPLLGINHGRLGFVADIPMTSIDEALKHLLQGHYQLQEHHFLEARIVRHEETIYHNIALNDIVLARSGHIGMMDLHIESNNEPMYHCRADGLIIATPIGSTAYAMSAGGPIMHPNINAFLLVAIAPQTLSNRPILIPNDSELCLTITDQHNKEQSAILNFDTQSWSDLQAKDKIYVKKSSHKATFLHAKDYSYYKTLREKLHWQRIPTETTHD
ncbi:MAG: NAD(+)/NADH kinase [Alcaligenaceae bacterium]|nr:NAD(+)/NADH kinase [Alcaligenaceae bacterium]